MKSAIAARRSRSPVNGSQLFAGAVSSASRVTRTASGGSGRSVSRFSMRRTGRLGLARAGSSAAAATRSIPKPWMEWSRRALGITGEVYPTRDLCIRAPAPLARACLRERRHRPFPLGPRPRRRAEQADDRPRLRLLRPALRAARAPPVGGAREAHRAVVLRWLPRPRVLPRHDTPRARVLLPA